MGGGGGHCFDRLVCHRDGLRESRGQTADIYFLTASGMLAPGKPLIRRLHGGINGEDILYGSSNDYVEKVYVYNKKKSQFNFFYCATSFIRRAGNIQNFDTIQPTYFKVHVFVSLPPFSIVFIYLF